MGRRQTFMSSCGAACLMTAARHLGTLSNRALLQGDDIEDLVYSYTSLGQEDGYSVPSGIVDACYYVNGDLGLRVREVRLEGLAFPRRLAARYPNELELVRGAGIPVRRKYVRTSGHAALPPQCLEMFVVIVGMMSSLHWLLHFGGNRYMDPDTGNEYGWWTSRNSWGYWDAGVSVLVEPGQPQAPCHAVPVGDQGNPGALDHTFHDPPGAWV